MRGFDEGDFSVRLHWYISFTCVLETVESITSPSIFPEYFIHTFVQYLRQSVMH